MALSKFIKLERKQWLCKVSDKKMLNSIQTLEKSKLDKMRVLIHNSQFLNAWGGNEKMIHYQFCNSFIRSKISFHLPQRDTHI